MFEKEFWVVWQRWSVFPWVVISHGNNISSSCYITHWREPTTDSLILSAGCSNASLCFIYIRTTNRIHCVQCIDEHQGRFLCGRLWVGSGHNKTKTKISKQRRNNNSWELENLFEVYFIKKSSSFESLLLWHYISKVLWV